MLPMLYCPSKSQSQRVMTFQKALMYVSKQEIPRALVAEFSSNGNALKFSVRKNIFIARDYF